jgi:hypothetical protein
MIANEKNLAPWAAVLDTEKIFNALSANRMSFGE